ncbi:MAG: N-acetylmuramoyl-L-alanine amidase [Clostridia bacterium]|nr:N-acetylmuramoyl-L-alanine amidase [Clostridia bacterium]
MCKKIRCQRLLWTVLSMGILLTMLCVSLSSCSIWQKLWERPALTDVPNELLLIPDPEAATEAFLLFEDAVEYTGKAHSGTDIRYNGTGDKRDKIIVIDAGHQAVGNNEQEPVGPGASSMKDKVTYGADGVFTKQEEHELNLKVALCLRDELIKRGYSVVMIRETAEVDISNRERAELANACGADAFIRIHANSYDDADMKGAMTLCHTQNNPYPDCAAHYPESRLLSEHILSAYCKETKMDQLPIREVDTYTGTNWSQVPTTILEMGFLSNASDDERMYYDTFHLTAAKGIADGVDAYFAALDAVAEETSEGSPKSQTNEP